MININIAPKIYKFAMYGRAASGKTCILAALAMKRIAHPQRYTCTWIAAPASVPAPEGPQEKWQIKEPAVAFHLGREWLQKAIDQLAKGELPPPNPNREEPLRYLYQFSTPGHRSFQIELIDYSGELIDPTITNDELSKRLRKHMHSMDGILVLAEAPYPGRDMEPLSEEMLKLEQAFVTLQEERKSGPAMDIPVAMLINKWDRRAQEEGLNSQNVQAELKIFLDSTPEPPHRSLVNVLENSVTKGNFMVFPISAFGEHELVKTKSGATIERPKQTKPLRSFGLEDGFIWATQRRDEIDLERFEKKIHRLSSWKFWQFFSLRHLRKEEEGEILAARFPENSRERTRVEEAIDLASRVFSKQIIFALVYMVVLVLGAENIYDGYRYRTVRANQDNPATDAAQLQKDEKWLKAYYTAPAYWHILSRLTILDRDTAKYILDQSQNKREDQFWDQTAREADPALQFKLAQRYTKLYPNGRYHEAATTILTRGNLQARYRGNEKYLEDIATSIKAMQAKGNPSQLEIEELQAKLEKLPEPEALNENILKKQAILRQELAAELIELAKAQGKGNWAKFREQYLELMRSGKITQAALHLSRWPVKSTEYLNLKKDFETRALQALEVKVMENIRAKQWEEGRSLIKQAMDDSRILSIFNQEQIKTLQRMLTSINQAQDRFLYEQAVKNKTMESISLYLETAPLKTMKEQVRAYQHYLVQMETPVEMTLNIKKITWGDLPFTYNNEMNTILVSIDGKEIIKSEEIRAKKFTTSKDVGSGSFKARLKDKVRLKVQAVSKGSWISWGDGDSGSANWEGNVLDLQDKTIKLVGKKQINRIGFSLSGLPVEPELPKWENKDQEL